jgi:type VI secretion system protein ImpF
MGLRPGKSPVTARGSVLDRLIDDEDQPQAQSMGMAELRCTVRRDLEMLLNTRRRCLRWDETLDQLDGSVFGYGLPDLLALDLADPGDREEFMNKVADIIRKSDARFREIRTTMLQNTDEMDRTLRFRIEAVVKVSPAEEQILFDSVVDPASKNITIRSR